MRPLPHALAALLLAGMLLAPPASAAEPVGRLFFTPEQRTALDIARSKRTRATLATDKPEEEAPPPPPTPEVVTYDGLVRRSDGKTTVWLNNRAISEKGAAGSRMVGKVRPDGTVTLQGTQSGRRVDLKVGQSAELLSGTIDEGYSRRKPEPKPDAAPADKPDVVPAAKPAADAAATAEADRKQEERERQQDLNDAVRALRDAAARAGATAPQPGASPTPPPGAAPAPPAK